MMVRVKALVMGVVGGVVGVAVALLLWHLYLDHRNHHALVDLVVRAQQQQAASAPGVQK